MRNEMVGAVVRRAIEHPGFRDELMKNPGQALSQHGFVLEQEDLREIEGVRSELRGDGDGDVEQKLVAIAERYGIDPEGDRPIPEQK